MVTNLAFLRSQTRAFRPCGRPFGRLWTHSSLQPLQKPAPSHPQIAQRKQRHQVGRVLGQPPVLDLDVAELPLDDPEGVFHLGPDAGLGLLQLLQDGSHGRALVHRTALARHHRNVPVHVGVLGLNLFALLNAPVARVGKDIGFFTMDQLAGLRHIIDVGCRAHHGVNQPRVGIHADVGFHAEVPLIALLGLVHLGVTGAGAVLGGTGCGNQGGVHHRALAQHQALVGERGVDGGQDSFGQMVFFQQVPESKDADPVRNAFDAGQADKLPVQRGLEEGLFHGQVGQAEPLLDEVDAQHGLQLKRGPAGLGTRGVRCNQRQQLRPRHHQVHLVQKHSLARAPLAQVQSKVLLLHSCIVRPCAAGHRPRGQCFEHLP